MTPDTPARMAGAPAFLTWEHLTPQEEMESNLPRTLTGPRLGGRRQRGHRVSGRLRGHVVPAPLPSAPRGRWVPVHRPLLTHVLRVQLDGRHLLEGNVAGPAVPAAAQAAPGRRGHGAATPTRRSARARVFLGRGSSAARTATPRRGGEAAAEERFPVEKRGLPGGAGRGGAGPEVGGAGPGGGRGQLPTDYRRARRAGRAVSAAEWGQVA